MHWQATCLSLVLVVPTLVQSQSLQSTDRNVTLTACVQSGSHGSVSNLSQIKLIALESVPHEAHRVMVWFDKNLDGFRDRVGQMVEIRGTIKEVLETDPGLKASDGVFANVDVPPAQLAASTSTVRSAATSGNATSQLVATGNDEETTAGRRRGCAFQSRAESTAFSSTGPRFENLYPWLRCCGVDRLALVGEYCELAGIGRVFDGERVRPFVNVHL